MYYTLIKKDYLLCGDTLTGILLIGACISCGLYLIDPGNVLGLLPAVSVATFLGFSTLAKILEKSHANPTLITSPYGRLRLLLARYLGWCGYSYAILILSLLLTGLLYALPFSSLPSVYYPLSDILCVAAFQTVLLALLIPCYTLLPSQWTTTAFLILVLLFNLLPRLFKSLSISFNPLKDFTPSPLLLFPAFLFLILSFLLTVLLYRRKEF